MSTLVQKLLQEVASPQDELEHARRASDSRQLRHQDQRRLTMHC